MIYLTKVPLSKLHKAANPVPEKQVAKTQPDINKQIPEDKRVLRNGQREFLQPYSDLVPSMANTPPPNRTNEDIEGEKQAMKLNRKSIAYQLDGPEGDSSIVIPETTLPVYERYTPVLNKQSFKNEATEKIIKKKQPTRSVSKGKPENNNTKKSADEWIIRRH